MSQISIKSFTMRDESLQRLGRPGLLPFPPKLTSPFRKFVAKSRKKQHILAGMYVPNDRCAANCSARNVVENFTTIETSSINGLMRSNKLPLYCSFGGMSPEKKAGQALRNMFTFLAARCAILWTLTVD